MKNKIKNLVIVVLTLSVVCLSLKLRSTDYELKQVQAANTNWSDFSDFQNSNHIAVTSELNARIQSLEHTNK
jgi:predicted nucleic-acid-binding Zn-ribbon protein